MTAAVGLPADSGDAGGVAYGPEEKRANSGGVGTRRGGEEKPKGKRQARSIIHASLQMPSSSLSQMRVSFAGARGRQYKSSGGGSQYKGAQRCAKGGSLERTTCYFAARKEPSQPRG